MTGSVIEKSKLESFLKDYVVKIGAYNREHVIFEFNNLPDKIEFQEDGIQMNVSEGSLNYMKGNITIPLEFSIDSKIIKRKYFSLKVRTFDSIYVARKYLKQNELISLDDLDIVWMETTYMNSQEVINFTSCSGKRIIKFFNKGQPLLLNFIDNLPIIEKGKDVRIMVKVNNIVIYSRGIARQDGKIGDKILVENSTSGSVIKAIVRDANVVELLR
jgi:flagellar basal body P-ring formation protein FlgA